MRLHRDVKIGLALVAVACAMTFLVRPFRKYSLFYEHRGPAASSSAPDGDRRSPSVDGLPNAPVAAQTTRDTVAAITARAVRVLVVDEQSHPIAGARLTIADDARVIGSSRTDATGRADVALDPVTPAVIAESLSTTVEAAGFVDAMGRVPISRGVDDVTRVVMERPKIATVRGVVRHGDGSPAVGVHVAANAMHRPFAATDFEAKPPEAKTDAAGRFEIANAFAGELLLVIAGNGAASRQATIPPLAPGAVHDVDLTVFDMDPVRIVVTDAVTGAAIPTPSFQANEELGLSFTWGTPMEVDRDDRARGVATETFRVGDDAGVIALDVRRGFALRGSVRAAGFERATIDAFATDELKVALRPLATHVVLLRDEAGNELCEKTPAQSFTRGVVPIFGPFVDHGIRRLTFEVLARDRRVPVEIDSQGMPKSVAFEHVVDEPCELVAFVEHLEIARARVESSDPGMLVVPRALACPPVGSVRFRVLDEDGKPPQRLLSMSIRGIVDAVPAATLRETQGFVSADARGSIVSNQCLPGTYAVRFESIATGASAVVPAVRVVAGATAPEIEVSLRSAGSLRIDCTADAPSVTRFRACLFDHDLEAYVAPPRGMPTDHDLLGVTDAPLLWKPLAPGSYRLEVRAGGFAVSTAEVRVEGSARQQVSIVLQAGARCDVHAKAERAQDAPSAIAVFTPSGTFVERSIPLYDAATRRATSRFTLAPGRYELRVTRIGATDEVRAIEVPPAGATIAIE